MKLRFRAALSAAAAGAVALGTLTAGPAHASLQPPVSGLALGVHFLDTTASGWPSVPYGTLRIWGNGFSWTELQPNAPVTCDPISQAAGTCTPSDGFDAAKLDALDHMIAGAHARGKAVIVVLGQTPAWAASSCAVTGGTYYYGAAATCPPASLTTWKTYVTRLMSLPHGSEINAFEIWNEANYHSFFNGTPSDAAQLTLATRQAISAMNRQTGILTPSVGARSGNPAGWIHSYLGVSASLGMPFNAVAVHLYPLGTNGPESMLPVLGQIRAQMVHYGVGNRQIWDTETSAGYKSTGQVMRGSDMSGRVLRTFLVELTNGVSRTVWYGWNDNTFSGDPINNGNALTYAGIGFRTAAAWLVGNRPYGPCHPLTTVSTSLLKYVWTCDIALKDGTHGRVVWNTNPRAAIYYTTPRGTFRIYNSIGGSKAVGGGYRWRLDVAPVLIRGHF